MEYINVEIVDRVATVTFDRPPVNALDAQAFREIEHRAGTEYPDHLAKSNLVVRHSRSFQVKGWP